MWCAFDAGPVFLNKLLTKRRDKEYIPWEERTNAVEEEEKQNKKKQGHGEKVKLKDGELVVSKDEEKDKAYYGSYKAELMLR